MTDGERPVGADGASGGTGAPRQPEDVPPETRKRRARWLYARVIVVQVVALVLLWLLQATYGS